MSLRTPRAGATVPVTPIAVRDGTARPRSDVVAAEEPLEIRLQAPGLGERALSITMRTPGNDFELAVGFLVAEGVVRSAADVVSVQYCVGGPEEQQFNIVTVILRSAERFDPERMARAFPMNSACGVCGKASLEQLRTQDPPPIPAGPVFDAALLEGLPAKLRTGQRVFERTGGIHAAGIFDATGRPLTIREDVGRHNAVDKAVGALLLEGRVPLGGCVLQVSGRASFEIMQKALMAGIPFVSAVGAPSSLAVALAQEYGMTLAAFVSEHGFNLYTGHQRVAGVS